MPKQVDLVRAFFEQCARENPKKFKEICDKYPTISYTQLKLIKEKEIPRGLLNNDEGNNHGS